MDREDTKMREEVLREFERYRKRVENQYEILIWKMALKYNVDEDVIQNILERIYE